MIHEGCEARMRINEMEDGGINVARKNAHLKNAVRRVTTGIAPEVRQHVETLAGLGLPPYTVKCQANEEARKDDYDGPDATTPQIRNYLREKARRMRKEKPLGTICQLREWAESIQVTEPGPAWEGRSASTPFVPPGGISTAAEAPCVVITTKGLLQNGAAVAVATTKYGVMVDGTYKLHRGGWTLLIIGTVSLNHQRGKIVQSFRPLGVCFSKSENEIAYTVFMTSVVIGLKDLFGVDFRPTTCAFDHCDAANNAARAVFLHVIPLSCWPHLSRNALKKGVYDIVVMLHRCSHKLQFDALHGAVVRIMEAAGCFTPQQIEFISDTSGKEQWRGWYVGASGVPGLSPNINPAERWNRAWKHENLLNGCRLSQEVLLRDKIPRALARDTKRKGGHIPVGVPPLQPTAAMVLRAHHVINRPSLWTRTATHLYVDGSTAEAQEMTPKRLMAFEDGLKGRIDASVKLGDLAKEYLHVRRVTMLTSRENSTMPASSGAPSAGADTVPAAVAGSSGTVAGDTPPSWTATGTQAQSLQHIGDVMPPTAATSKRVAAETPVDENEGERPNECTRAATTPPQGPGARDPGLDATDTSFRLNGEEDDEYVDEEEAGDELINNSEGDSDDNGNSVAEEEDALETEELRHAGSDTDGDDEAEYSNHVATAPPLLPSASLFECTCPRYWAAGICYHIVLYGALIMNKTLDEEVQQLPTVRRAGRKRKTASALNRQP
eukprot:GHVU01050166.1.p1 GENE.GHVU01050166.1~~GHVU01050166.1.p1  ORF type:complete len:723 (-),score=90.20 GHVU01050166.1:1438-3606(-)